MSRIKLAWIIDSLGMGGAERLMVPILQNLDRDRYESRVCVLQIREGNPIAGQLAELDIPVDQVSVPRLRDITAVPRLITYLRQHQIQLVHTQLEFANTLGTLAAARLGIPAVCTLHTLDQPLRGYKAYRRLKLMWWVLRHFNQRIVAVSGETRQHYLQISHDAPEKVTTIYNGIDLSRFDPPGTNHIRQEFSIPLDAPLLITVAVLRQPKGIQFMLEALPEIIQTIPQIRYLIVGDGPYRATLEELTHTYQLNDHVIFAGMRQDIPALLSTANIFVLPTLTEALPTVLAEAMAACKPIIASAVGGVPEMVLHDQNGLLVPPCDPAVLAQACINLLCHPDKQNEMGQHGRQLVEERFNIIRQAQQLGELYDGLVATQ